MNSKQNNKSQDQNTKRLKEIPKWTRKYAQNRTLTIIVLMAMIMLFTMFFAGLLGFLLPLAVGGFRKGNIILGCVGTAGLVAVLAAVGICMFIFIRKFGGKNRGLIDQIIERRIYGKEGTVSIPMLKSSKKKICLEIAATLVWGILFFGTLYLGIKNYIPAKYVQPVSALYCVPFTVFSWYFWQSPRMGPIYLLHPILYAIHAILIVAGVPLFFTGFMGPFVNMGLPCTGYGFLTFIIGHLYSRYALKKLKDIAHLEKETTDGA